MAMTDTPAAKRPSRRKARGAGIAPWLFISPWILGFLFFTLGPLTFSLIMSLYDWPVVGTRTFIGIENYKSMVLYDPQFWESLWITVKFAAIFVPLNIILSFLLAVLLNTKVRGTGFFRTAFYSTTSATRSCSCAAITLTRKNSPGCTSRLTSFT